MRLSYKVIRRGAVILLIVVASAGTPCALESNVTPLQSIFIMKELIPQTQTIGLMWNQSMTNTDELLPKIQRASVSVGVKVVIEDVEELSDVSEKFRDLKNNYHIQTLWIIEDNSPMNTGLGKDFLVKNSIINGIALFAPNTDWVSAGACVALLSGGGTVKLYMNKKTITALGIKIPGKYLQDTQFVTTN